MLARELTVANLPAGRKRDIVIRISIASGKLENRIRAEL